MITSKVTNLPKSTVEIEITISWDEIKSTYDKIFEKISQDIEVSGFRKGKAPKDLVEKQIDRTKLYEEVIKEIVPGAYSKVLTENKLKPVSAPKIEVLSALENKNWSIKATLALKPVVNLKNYKEKIRELKKNKVKIWTPGTGQDKEKKDNKPALEELLNTLISEIDIELSDILVTEEANRLLSNLLDQTAKLGLTVEQYLMSKGKTSEQMRAEYAQLALKNLKIEFIIADIAEKENITVTPEDLDKILSKVEKPEERENLKKDSYYLAHLIRQQKTLDYLYNL